MFSLIYNLLNIPHHAAGSRNEKSNLKIINCVNENGDLVDDDFFANESSYELELSYNGEYWCINVFLYFGMFSWNLIKMGVCTQLHKYQENIVMNGYDNGFVLNYVDDLKTNPRRENEIKGAKNGRIAHDKQLYWGPQPCISAKDNKFNNPAVHSDFCVECNKTTRTNYFRKTLGILKEKIATTVFKFIIECRVTLSCRWEFEIYTITYETEQFRFDEDEDGNLIIKKVLNMERCHETMLRF
ncbi:hypothetical protein CDIK_1890 [Cucumispora dikerogammari]|nr:hypothetical protein CDIK_1890 [Cucumispora dikerogammari]